MRQNTLLNSTIARSSGYKRLAESAVQYLGMNTAACLVDEYTNAEIMKRSCTQLKTPVSILFEHIYEFYKGQKHPLVHVYISSGSAPEMLTTDQIIIDCAEVLKNYNSVFDNCIVNYTNILTLDGIDKIKLQDLSSVQNLYVKASLCSHYNMTDDRLWLTAQMAIFVMQSFATVMITLLRTTFNITDPIVLRQIRLVLMAYYAQKLEPETGKRETPKLLYRTERGKGVDIDEFYGMMADAGFDYSTNYSLIDLLKMLKHAGGERFESLEMERMIKVFTSGSGDLMSSIISLEYPPYWTYLLLAIASGAKHPVYNNIFRNTGMKHEVAAFADDLNRYNDFIPMLSRKG